MFNKLSVLCILIINSYFVNGYRVFNVSDVDTILAMENEEIMLDCKSNNPMPMAYCGFVHPSGKRYAFSGPDLDNGRCYVKFKVTKHDNGMWKCHIGRKTMGLEVMHKMEVRTVGFMAAIKKNVHAIHRKPVTLKCVTTGGLTPLSYCRFEPPNSSPFSIDPTVTLNNSIQNRFFYPSNHSLYRGDCAVTIRKVKFEDVGLWTCGAGFDDGKEHIDVIKVEVEGLYTMSTASVTGISFGVIGAIFILGLVGLVAWKRHSYLGSQHHADDIEMPEVVPMAPQPSRPVSPTTSRPRSRMSPRNSPRTSPKSSPRGSRTESPSRNVPILMVQSPSEPSTSP